jgi:hypothetical protein
MFQHVFAIIERWEKRIGPSNQWSVQEKWSGPKGLISVSEWTLGKTKQQ